jgi:hypothetical protein
MSKSLDISRELGFQSLKSSIIKQYKIATWRRLHLNKVYIMLCFVPQTCYIKAEQKSLARILDSKIDVGRFIEWKDIIIDGNCPHPMLLPLNNASYQ